MQKSLFSYRLITKWTESKIGRYEKTYTYNADT